MSALVEKMEKCYDVDFFFMLYEKVCVLVASGGCTGIRVVANGEHYDALILHTKGSQEYGSF